MRAIWLFLLIFVSLQAVEFAEVGVEPIPDSIPFDEQKARLGKKLYLDANLSKDKTISCNSCHPLENYGVDNLRLSLGVGGATNGATNSPTSFNSVFNFVQFWDGRAKDLQEQAAGPLLNPVEHGMTEDAVVAAVKDNPEYVKSFGELYEEGITFLTITDAIAEFEKTLLTPNSPFDKWLKGDENAITPAAKRGFEAFKSNGCISCHQGQNVGGNMYQKIGIFEPYNGSGPNGNLGRYNVTQDENDKLVFKVPSLRNIAKTAPYFHDGSVETLEVAVQLMAFYQLGKFLDNEVVMDIVSFLESLTGEYNDKLQ
ncbi:cytochrome-c peroxidase [Helicobacter canadensis]|uniref:Cytochrome c551 peroxidase n=1 Tax=Helicobacter canadensis MIT 98-5491 TaxID=537970 RepID=C5ZV21_9HELI|nr:cytochrome-c peroxidase [Helicobacter canadensis]EES88835.1 cytochrome c551 peroxidase [Helicobacter canadensis MIT 98-5491]EFR48867.1 cytochrome c551 peroxidase [Helicobacter canadensis MIT 98-5491]STP00101.1 cytochrome c551 peroxidase [Helicobacter canadensis]